MSETISFASGNTSLDSYSDIFWDSGVTKYAEFYDSDPIKITVIDINDVNKLSSSLEDILDGHPISIDFEWKPDNKTRFNPISLFQFATSKGVLIVLNNLENGNETIRQFLLTHHFFGKGLSYDQFKLKKMFNETISIEDIEISRLKPHNLSTTFTELVNDLIGEPAAQFKDKNVSCSDWSKRPLSVKQILYAAFDAYAMRRCWEVLVKKFKESEVIETPIVVKSKIRQKDENGKHTVRKKRGKTGRTVPQMKKQFKPKFFFNVDFADVNDYLYLLNNDTDPKKFISRANYNPHESLTSRILCLNEIENDFCRICHLNIKEKDPENTNYLNDHIWKHHCNQIPAVYFPDQSPSYHNLILLEVHYANTHCEVLNDTNEIKCTECQRIFPSFQCFYTHCKLSHTNMMNKDKTLSIKEILFEHLIITGKYDNETKICKICNHTYCDIEHCWMKHGEILANMLKHRPINYSEECFKHAIEFGIMCIDKISVGMMYKITGSSASAVYHQSTENKYFNDKRKIIISGQYSIIDRFFPFYDQITQNTSIHSIIYAVFYLIIFAQLLSVSSFSLIFSKSQTDIYSIFNWIIFGNLRDGLRITTLIVFIIYSSLSFFLALLLCITYFYFIRNKKVIPILSTFTRINCEILPAIMIIPLSSFVGNALFQIINGPKQWENNLFFTLGLCYYAWFLLIFVLSFKLLNVSPYLSYSIFGCYDGSLLINLLSFNSIISFISSFGDSFTTWIYIFVVVILILITLYDIKCMLYYPFIHKFMNIIVSGSLFSYIFCSLTSLVHIIVNIYTESFIEYLFLITSIVGFVIGCITAYFLIKIKQNKIMNIYSKENANNLTLNQKIQLIKNYNLQQDYKLIGFLRIGIEKQSLPIIDGTLFKYLLEHEVSTSVLSQYLRIMICFPHLSQLFMKMFNNLLEKQDLKLTDRFVLYQSDTIHEMRQLISSTTMIMKLGSIIKSSNNFIDTMRGFWLDVPNNVSIFHELSKKLANEKSQWVSLLSSFPNNSIATENYSTFLIDGAAEFSEGVYQHYRANKQENGYFTQNDVAFRSLMRNFPFYLKKKIIDINGNIIQYENNDKNNRFDECSSNNSIGNSSKSIVSFHDMTYDIEAQIAKLIIHQSRPKLYLQKALSQKRSLWNQWLKFFSVCSTLLFCSIFLISFCLFNNFYEDKRRNITAIKTISSQRFSFMNALFYVGLQWTKGTGSFNNEHILRELNLKEQKNVTFMDMDINEILYSMADFVAQNLSQMMIDTGNFAVDGYDIFQAAPDFINSNLKLYFAHNHIKNETTESEIKSDDNVIKGLSKPINVNFKHLATYMTYLCYNLSFSTLSEVSTWNKNPVFIELLSNMQEYTKSLDNMFEIQGSTQILSKDKKTKFLNIYSGIIPVISFIISIPAFISINIMFHLEKKNILKIFQGIDSKVKEIASNSLTIKGSDSKPTKIQFTGNNAHIIWCISISFIYTCLILLTCAVCIVSISYNHKITLLSQWVLYSHRCNCYLLEILSLLTLALNLNQTNNIVYPSQKFLIQQSRDALNHLQLSYGNLIEGDNKYTSIIGFDNEIDDIIMDQSCTNLTSNNTYQAYASTIEEKNEIKVSTFHDLVLCSTLGQNLALLENLVSVIQYQAIDMIGVQSLEFYQLKHIVTYHLIHEFDIISGKIFYSANDAIDMYNTTILIVVVFSFISSFLALGIVWISILQNESDYALIMRLVRRLPAGYIVGNKKLKKYVLGIKKIDRCKRCKKNSSSSKKIFDETQDAIISLSKNFTIEMVNPAVTTLFGYSPDQLLGQHINIILKSEENQEIYKNLHLIQCGESSTTSFQIHSQCVNDSDLNVSCLLNVIGIINEKDHNKEISSYILILTDETLLLKQQYEAEKAKEESAKLLYNILPRTIVQKIHSGEKNISFIVDNSSIIFIDICSFSEYSSLLSPQEIMNSLSMIFNAFDRCVDNNHQSEILKIKLIGDVYMAAAGIFTQDKTPQVHAEEIIQFGLEAILALEEVNSKLSSHLQVRVGVNSGGPIIAGVLGTDKPVFDIIGDTINVAARLQSTDIPGNIQISQATYELIEESDFRIEKRGEVFLKGKGKSMTYLVKPKTMDFLNTSSESVNSVRFSDITSDM
ncbi:hypothetical protein TRFO_09863 [Tritrichomonas foetus]|uniref:Adenylate and Guanylate cyclase catalytic domain containing protein n=1 Tax=Tritrichomonas foetus TaxID=1144522 RepID=A0A1J4JDG4_9EUKA|nr:hypothetical protein TRFO_09863 [Tritrichomonas foetus]|eukprot:OHS96697.1 hypothetical protein TRFO_09863 [Tritrichomonas foetus]